MISTRQITSIIFDHDDVNVADCLFDWVQYGAFDKEIQESIAKPRSASGFGHLWTL